MRLARREAEIRRLPQEEEQMSAAVLLAATPGIGVLIRRAVRLVAVKRVAALGGLACFGHSLQCRRTVPPQALGGICGAAAGIPLLDPVAGLCVSGMIAKTAAEVGLDACRQLTDTAPDEVLEQVAERLASMASMGVRSHSHLRARSSGLFCARILCERVFWPTGPGVC